MEGIGNVNRYTCAKCSNYFNVVLLNTGVTPFLCMCSNCNSDMQSTFYNVGPIYSDKITINCVAYRPKHLPHAPGDLGTIDHVLRGGLIFAPIGSDIEPLFPDCGDLDGKAFAEYCFEHYGVKHD